MPDLWVVVASSSEAHIYAGSSVSAPLTLVESLSHAEARVHPRDRLADVPGRVQDSFGPGRHGLDRNQQLRDEDRQQFAREITALLTEALRRKRFDRLIVMSGPGFLGALRDEFGKDLVQATIAEVPKDLVAKDVAAIQAHIP